MARLPSAETQLRRVRADLKDALSDARRHKVMADNYHTRLIEAEREVFEWKRRFDALLALKPDVPPKGIENDRG